VKANGDGEQTRGDRKAYRLKSQPISSGGQADVYEAERRWDGKILVLKRVREPSDQPRMRREIEVQASLNHANIMPILDWDTSGFTWYVMPKGTRVMSGLTRPLELSALLQIVDSVAAALEVAHASGHPHRDLKPHNIVELVDDDGRVRWVLADWGLTRRPLGETVTPLTRTGQMLGTEGFAPPEAYRDAHEYGEAGDVFALGQVIAWGTGSTPVPNAEATASEPWNELVAAMTKLRPSERLQTVTEVRLRLRELALARNGPRQG
jgi:serine/threonine protein kinase